MENDFKFGDIVYYRAEKCVYMGFVKGNRNTVEVLFEGNVLTSTVDPEELSKELPVIKFVESNGEGRVYFSVTNGIVEINITGVKADIYFEDIDKFIDCLNQVKERYSND